MIEREQTLEQIRGAAVPLTGAPTDYDRLLERARGKRLVLLGEASHGTHEFYAERARITRRLVDELAFDGVAVEADWPDAYRVNRYIRGDDRDVSVTDALGGFQRFPQWMWRNDDVVSLLEWLRVRNAAFPEFEHAGFYGIDLYSLHGSIDEVLGYLWRVDPDAARRARERYSCFESFGSDPQEYGYATSFGAESCEEAVVRQLVELQRNARRYMNGFRADAADEHFMAEQNARLVHNAERYYRAMFRGRVSSWNLRDTHMAETIDALLAHLGRDGHESRLVVWAHNSHLGDARATEMGARGELNLGQLLRERYDDAVLSVGFTTHTGEVTAARDWDARAETRTVEPSLANSYERLLHDSTIDRFYLDVDAPPVRRALREPRLERAIGVIYRPETERQSHYFHARLSDQFNAVIHLDETTAVRPLDEALVTDDEELPETFPSSL
ncbi:MAG TPA: erythromycin esterase family protein [Gemmatimonadaceae bacterium]|nr:erythromycin esterase family protein [Gemmatimonadaceae bacterium]